MWARSSAVRTGGTLVPPFQLSDDFCVHPTRLSGAITFHLPIATHLHQQRFGIAIAPATAMLEQSTISRIPHTGSTFNIDAPAIAISPARRRPAIGILDGLRRRLRREARRRKVGRAYDMALEISQYVPRYSRILDTGCGSGYIAHHLTAMLEADVTGIDLAPSTDAPIDYKRFDGVHFPVQENAFDVVLLCYVLHHAQKLEKVLSEVRRALNKRGIAVVYEDMPDRWWDRLVCAFHDLKWRKRTGPCTFRGSTEWQQEFTTAGFEVMFERDLSRWRNLAHPVKRRLFVIALDQNHARPI